MFHTIASSGHPAVGFSTKAFMRTERRRPSPLTVAHVVEDYQKIIAAACAELRLPPDAPVVLTGWSRGAALAVLVASSREVDPGVVGLVAVGLAADERLDIDGDDDDATEVPGVADAGAHAQSIALYPLLAGIPPRPSVAIQSSGAGSPPAARAR